MGIMQCVSYVSIMRRNGVGHIISGIMRVLLNKIIAAVLKHCCLMMNHYKHHETIFCGVSMYLLLIVFTIGRLQRFL